jgi:hypothetical protein
VAHSGTVGSPDFVAPRVVLLTGEIVERQRNRQTRERKFVVRGITVGGLRAEAVLKFGPLGNLFIITVYLV